MDKELKGKWVEALRSGKYPQAWGALCRTRASASVPEGYCCLGVLADVAGVPWLAHCDADGIDSGYKALVYESNDDRDLPSGHYTAVLPLSFMDSIGLTSDATIDLIGMNDGGLKGFPEIADWIEEHL